MGQSQKVSIPFILESRKATLNNQSVTLPEVSLSLVKVWMILSNTKKNNIMYPFIEIGLTERGVPINSPTVFLDLTKVQYHPILTINWCQI